MVLCCGSEQQPPRPPLFVGTDYVCRASDIWNEIKADGRLQYASALPRYRGYRRRQRHGPLRPWRSLPGGLGPFALFPACLLCCCASVYTPHSFRTRAQYASRARRRALSQVGGNKGDRVRPSRSIPFDLRDAFLSDGASGEHERAAPVSAALSRPWECDLVQQHVPLCKRFDQVQLRHLRRWRAGCRAFIHPWCRLSPSL